MVENIILKNLSTSALLELDVTTTPYYILDTVDWGQIDATHHSYKYVNQMGVTIIGTTLESRDVSITGWIIANSEEEMDSRKHVLNRFVNPQQYINIKYKTYSLDFKPSKTIQYTANVVDNNEVVCKFKISGVAADPLFRDSGKSMVTAAVVNSAFHFPLAIDVMDNGKPTILFGYKNPSLILNVYNKGDTDIGFTIKFRARGTVVNPSVIDVNTQKFMKIQKTFEDGEEVVIDTVVGERKITGMLNGVESNYFKYKSLDSSWLDLKIGDNILRYDAEEGVDALEVYFYFYNRYLEVEGCY